MVVYPAFPDLGRADSIFYGTFQADSANSAEYSGKITCNVYLGHLGRITHVPLAQRPHRIALTTRNQRLKPLLR
jgi:hypothetical protein